MERRKWYGLLFIAPSLAGLLVFYIIPFLASFYYVFTQGVSEIKFVWLQNFIDLFQSPAFLLALKNTLIFMAIGVPVLTLSALALSLMMSDKLHTFARGSILTPMIVPVASALLGWNVIFGAKGMVNGAITLTGANPVDFFSDPAARWVLLLIFILKNLGYMLIIFTGAITSLSKEYREAFLLDSSSNFKYARRVVIPLIAPIIFFVVILSLVNCFQIFREVYGLYGNYPTNDLYMLQNFMNNNFFKLNYQRLSTAAFILVLFISFLIAGYIRYQRKSEEQ